MFNEYKSAGKHMICDFKEIKNIDLLNNCEELNLDSLKKGNVFHRSKNIREW